MTQAAGVRFCSVSTAFLALPVLTAPIAAADNSRLNNGVVADVYAVQHRAGCPGEITANPSLQRVAELQTRDVLSNGDGSNVQSRAVAAGFAGAVSQTIAVNPALAINNLDVITQWFNDPQAYAIMSDCRNTTIGVWSENSLNRSVVVAVYGRPD